MRNFVFGLCVAFVTCATWAYLTYTPAQFPEPQTAPAPVVRYDFTPYVVDTGSDLPALMKSWGRYYTATIHVLDDQKNPVRWGIFKKCCNYPNHQIGREVFHRVNHVGASFVLNNVPGDQIDGWKFVKTDKGRELAEPEALRRIRPALDRLLQQTADAEFKRLEAEAVARR